MSGREKGRNVFAFNEDTCCYINLCLPPHHMLSCLFIRRKTAGRRERVKQFMQLSRIPRPHPRTEVICATATELSGLCQKGSENEFVRVYLDSLNRIWPSLDDNLM
ncbi:Hypothetical protein NTJ_15902 [Nesidiocoris tenuis]|uniref:Uncharacterized protein n=1 Tax=Nesidiocoris tenuis TaxID=355587 RepID=A0ABN7BFJ3_9HEMI|nr:Hypothetical protein NTJ_15902 [Nesidiocoris tenuis]